MNTSEIMKSAAAATAAVSAARVAASNAGHESLAAAVEHLKAALEYFAAANFAAHKAAQPTISEALSLAEKATDQLG